MSTGAKPSFSWVNPRAHGPGAARRGSLRSTARTIRGTTGAGTITAAPAPPPTPHPHAPRRTQTHPDAPRITFRERNAIVTMRLPLLAHLRWDTDKAVALMLWLHTVVPVISVKALGSVA